MLAISRRSLFLFRSLLVGSLVGGGQSSSANEIMPSAPFPQDQACEIRVGDAVEAGDSMDPKSGSESLLVGPGEGVRPQKGWSASLILDGASSIAKEVFKEWLKKQKVLPISFRGKFLWEIDLTGPAQGYDFYDNVTGTIDTEEKLRESGADLDSVVNWGLAYLWEFKAPFPLKIAYGGGQIAIGVAVAVAAAKVAFDEFTESFQESKVNRLLVGKGGFWEHYASFLARGTTPFYMWGLPKERGLKEDLSNLVQAFKSPQELERSWTDYVEFMRPIAGRAGGLNRADFDASADRALQVLLEEWGEQVKMELALMVKDYTDQAMPGFERDLKKWIAHYRSAALIIIGANKRTFTLTGRARGLRAASLENREFSLKVDGEVLRAHVVRVTGTVRDDGTYAAYVHGLRPGMSYVQGYADPNQAGTFRRVSKETELPVFPKLFKTFDQLAVDAVKAPPDTIGLDLDFGEDPECADLDPKGKGLDKGAFYSALGRHQKCLAEGRAAVDAPPAGARPRQPDAAPEDAAKRECVECVNGLVSGDCYVRVPTLAGWGLSLSCGKGGGVTEENKFIDTKRCAVCKDVRWDLCDFKPAPKDCVPQCRSVGSCPKRDSASAATPAEGGGAPPPTAAPTGQAPLRLTTVEGAVSYHLEDASDLRPLRDGDGWRPGMTLVTGRGGRVVIETPNKTRVILEPGSRVRPSTLRDGRQSMRVLAGGVVVERDPGAPGYDDVVVESEDGSIQGTGTRYSVRVGDRGTSFQVLEGSARVTGERLSRARSSSEEGDGPLVQDIQLRAGESAFALRAGALPSGGQRPPDERVIRDGRPPTDDMSRPDPWNDPRVQALIDEWLRTATPMSAATHPGTWRFSEWGQVLGPGSQAVGAPSHPAGWSRHQSLWAMRSRFASLNLCTLGEFVERRLSNKPLEDCAKQSAPAREEVVDSLANGSFSQGREGFQTGYTFTTAPRGLYNAGTCAVGSDPTFYHPAFTGRDHTTGRGDFLMVNAAVAPDVPVWSQTISVPERAGYEFAAWITSLTSGNPARLRVEINGETVANWTAPAGTGIWKHYSLDWYSGYVKTARVTIYEEGRGSTGGDFGLDDLSFDLRGREQ